MKWFPLHQQFIKKTLFESANETMVLIDNENCEAGANAHLRSLGMFTHMLKELNKCLYQEPDI